MKSFYWPSFSLEGKEKLLVYEFVPNKSLDYFIFDPTKKAQLDWDRQYKIIRGMKKLARGDSYRQGRMHVLHNCLH
ncbi:hypothetical protein GLYMA_09G255150v4 [Glycine max]|nr:hypothetical protein GLYMA_09G255150v4 [Glycine max]KAH1044776.1 hypothetical protein GYH30_026167 [Glycine max]